MSLRTFINYSDPVVGARIADIIKGLASPVLLEGGEVTIPFSNTLRFAPFKAVLPSGVILASDESHEFNFDLTTAANTFTLTVDHTYEEISGGVPPRFSKKDNILSASHVPNSLILAWVKYPGSSQALSHTMVYRPRPDRIQESSTKERSDYRVAPLQGATILQNGSTLTESVVYDSGYVSTKYENVNPSLGIVKKLYPFVAGNYPPGRLFVEARADFQASITFNIVDNLGNSYSPSNNVISDSGWKMVEMEIPNIDDGQFSLGSIFYVEVTTQLNPSTSVNIASFGLSTYNLPATV